MRLAAAVVLDIFTVVPCRDTTALCRRTKFVESDEKGSFLWLTFLDVISGVSE
jgi:hypothetical protein